jgi:hypothetical protein
MSAHGGGVARRGLQESSYGGGIGNSSAKPQTALILGLPRLHDPSVKVEERLRYVLDALRPSLRQLGLASPPVLFSTDALPPPTLKAFRVPVELFVRHSFEFWSRPRSYYGCFAGVTLHLPRMSPNDKQSLSALVKPAFGREPAWSWLPGRGTEG